MNYRLDAMCERVWLFTDMQGDYAVEKLEESKQRIADFARGARQHSFIFRDMNGKGRAAYVGSEQPKAMALISLAVDKDMPELRRTYQRLLSATAHSGVHGLARMLTPVSPNEGRPGEALAVVNIDPRTLAVELIVGPLTAHSLARGIEWLTGSDMTGTSRPREPRCLRTQLRIGRMNMPRWVTRQVRSSVTWRRSPEIALLQLAPPPRLADARPVARPAAIAAGWPGGISPPGSHRTERESLPSLRSSHP